jgi:hypothetical protein
MARDPDVPAAVDEGEPPGLIRRSNAPWMNYGQNLCAPSVGVQYTASPGGGGDLPWREALARLRWIVRDAEKQPGRLRAGGSRWSGSGRAMGLAAEAMDAPGLPFAPRASGDATAGLAGLSPSPDVP